MASPVANQSMIEEKIVSEYDNDKQSWSDKEDSCSKLYIKMSEL